MIRAKRVYIRAPQKEFDRLFECNRESARVWDECLRLAKEHHVNSGTWISKDELQTQTKSRYHLHSQSIQAVTHKYIFAREATRQSKKQGMKKAKYPYRKKEHFNTKWVKDGFKVHPSGKVELSMGIHGRKREKPIVVYASNLPEGVITEIEFCYDNGPYLAVSFEDGKENNAYRQGHAVGVDLGDIHGARNILSKGLYGEMEHIDVGTRMKYLCIS